MEQQGVQVGRAIRYSSSKLFVPADKASLVATAGGTAADVVIPDPKDLVRTGFKARNRYRLTGSAERAASSSPSGSKRRQVGTTQDLREVSAMSDSWAFPPARSWLLTVNAAVTGLASTVVEATLDIPEKNGAGRDTREMRHVGLAGKFRIPSQVETGSEDAVRGGDCLGRRHVGGSGEGATARNGDMVDAPVRIRG